MPQILSSCILVRSSLNDVNKQQPRKNKKQTDSKILELARSSNKGLNDDEKSRIFIQTFSSRKGAFTY